VWSASTIALPQLNHKKQVVRSCWLPLCGCAKTLRYDVAFNWSVNPFFQIGSMFSLLLLVMPPLLLLLL
jgi:hypothetical protein